jgi:uncharacterized protein DUF669
MARAKKKSRIVEIDFTNVEEGGGGSFKIPEGNYLVEVTEVEQTESEAGNDMFKWTFTGKEGKAKSKIFYQYTTLNEEALWKLRGLLEALGVDVPKGPLDLDLDEMVGLELTAVVGDEEYKGKTSSRMIDFEPADGAEEEEEEKSLRGKKKKIVEEEDEEEEKSARGKKKSKSKEPDKVAADEVKGMDEDELKEVIKKYDLEVDLDDHKTIRRKASAVIAELEEKDLLEEE